MAMGGFLKGKDEDDWISYDYWIGITIKCPNHNPVTLRDVQIQGMLIEKDYDNDNLPVIIVNIMINQEWDKWIREAKERCEFTVQVQKRVVEEDTTQRFKKGILFSTVFSPIITDDTPTLDEDLRKKIKDGDGDEDRDMTIADSRNRYCYTLVRKDDLEATKKIVNKIIPQADMTTILSFLLSKAKCKTVLFSNIDNNKIYNEFKLLPIPLLTQLQYLNSFHGLHKEGTQIFFDIDRTYINRMSGKCTAWEKNEPTHVTFFLHDRTDSDIIAKGTIVVGDNVYHNIDNNSILINNRRMVSDQIVGDNVMLVDTSSTKFDVSEEINTGGNNFTVRQNVGYNPYIEEQIKLRKAENRCVVTIVCSEIDISHITPNKEYVIITDNSQYADILKGNYRLTKITTTFSRTDVAFSAVNIITLKKIQGSTN